MDKVLKSPPFETSQWLSAGWTEGVYGEEHFLLGWAFPRDSGTLPPSVVTTPSHTYRLSGAVFPLLFHMIFFKGNNLFKANVYSQ